MTHRRIHIPPALLVALALAALLGLTACAGGHKTQDPKAGINLSDLAQDVFVLADQHDMGFAVVKLEKEGYNAEHLTKAARHLTVNHFLAALKSMSAKVAVVQSSPSDMVIQAHNLLIDGVAFSEGAFRVRHERHRVDDVEVTMAKLSAVALDNKDQTVAVSWILYRETLRQAVP